MANPSPQVIARVAGQANLVPALIWAYGQNQNAFTGDEFNDELWARQASNELAEAIQTHGTIEAALSKIKSGDPDAYRHANNSAAGFVNGILGLAGSRADYGMDGFKPADPKTFTEHANDIHEVFDSLSSLGGVVDPEVVQRLAVHLQQHTVTSTPQPKPQQQLQKRDLPIPSGPKPQDVAGFVNKAKSLGIDPQHFAENFGPAATMSRKLMGKSLTLEDYAPMAQMNQQQIQEHIRSQPHPYFPEISTGAYHDAYGAATLHSWKLGRFPQPAEAKSFAELGVNPKEIGAYYQEMAQAKKGLQPDQPKQVEQPKPAEQPKQAVKANG